jgi:hypothetical protein
MFKGILDEFYKIMYIFYIKMFYKNKNSESEILDNKMRLMLEKCNSGNFSNDQMYIISVRSKSLAKFLNEKSPSFGQKLREFEEHNIILNKICKSLFKKFAPMMIYAFNDEFLLVFNRSKIKVNINKRLTSITSYITQLLTIEMINQDINLDLVLSAKWISFINNFDVLNYIVSRQSRCTLLNLNLLHCYFEKIERKSKDKLQLDILNIPESKLIQDFIIYGSTFYYCKFCKTTTIEHTQINHKANLNIHLSKFIKQESSYNSFGMCNSC